MVLSRNGMRDERRRRALIDETLHGTAAEAVSSSAPDEGREASARARVTAYSAAARVDNHAPISVCIPKRPLSVWGLMLVGACFIAGIESLYAQIFLQVSPQLQASLTALDLSARGSLASWFASVVLCCGSMASVLVYLIRRHRTDDYRGRYRWWLWLAPLLLVLSVNAGTGLHQAFSGLLTSLSGAEVAVEGKGWWLIAYGAVFFPIVLQLAIEMWPSRLATAYFFATVVAYVLVGGFEIHAIQCSTPLTTTLCHSSLLLSAHFGVLLTILAYGRYVYLEAHDSLAERRRWRIRLPRLRRQKKGADDTAGEEGEKSSGGSSRRSKRLRVDNTHSKFGQETATSAAPATVTAAALTADDSSGNLPADSDKKFSKADRKRLRREGQQQ